jgi:cobalt-zinc-cadmium efflux system protein
LGAVGIMLTGWIWLDPLMSLIITVLIFFGTWDLLKDSMNLLLDAVPNNIEIKAVQTYLEELPGVLGIHDLHIWAMSTTENALTTHLIVSNHQLDNDFLLKVNKGLQDNFGLEHTTIQLENDNNTLNCNGKKCYF